MSLKLPKRPDLPSNLEIHPSTTFTIKTGVPQGSCLSPTLFNIFFSDISDHILKNIHRALYADDLGILYNSDKLKAIESNLQIAVNEINAFCTKWGLVINKSRPPEFDKISIYVIKILR